MATACFCYCLGRSGQVSRLSGEQNVGLDETFHGTKNGKLLHALEHHSMFFNHLSIFSDGAQNASNGEHAAKTPQKKRKVLEPNPDFMEKKERLTLEVLEAEKQKFVAERIYYEMSTAKLELKISALKGKSQDSQHFQLLDSYHY